jgi:4-diphosphocytidyl-2-C-methyl-D-erythritol kinase
VIVFPNAKINLGLSIVEKRKDGFHNIETIFYPIGLSDVLEVVEGKAQGSSRIKFNSTGIAIPGNGQENLCIKAYNLVATDYDLPRVHVHLHKIVPIGAGLGGGSSDAAFFLKAINELFDLNLAFGELHHYARKLGSDCSFFINNKPAFAQGKGDEMESIKVNFCGKFLVLVKPNIFVSTQAAYSGVIPSRSKTSLEKIIELPISKWKQNLKNQFEETIFLKYPELAEIKKLLYQKGAEYAAMSGSGSSIFGLFSSPVSLKKDFPDSFVWEETLL